ncbi:MAG: hypothetical protein AAF771_01960 [Pseudomonadota bacterium]
MTPRQHEFERVKMSQTEKMNARLEALRITVAELEAMGFTPPAAFSARLNLRPLRPRRAGRRNAP